MSMGKRKRDRQPAMWVTTTDLPTAASHPFYRRVNQLLREHGFDEVVEAQCAGFYAARDMGARRVADTSPAHDWFDYLVVKTALLPQAARELTSGSDSGVWSLSIRYNDTTLSAATVLSANTFGLMN